jgi:hypothetical protein
MAAVQNLQQVAEALERHFPVHITGAQHASAESLATLIGAVCVATAHVPFPDFVKTMAAIQPHSAVLLQGIVPVLVHYPRAVQAYWLTLALHTHTADLDTLIDTVQGNPHEAVLGGARATKVDDDDDDDDDGGAAGGTAPQSHGDDWDTETYTTDLRGAMQKFRATVQGKVALDHMSRVHVALHAVKAVCDAFGVPFPHGAALPNDRLGDKPARCAAVRTQVQSLRPALKALTGSALPREYPVLWEALQEYLAAALGTPLNSTLDLVPGGVESLEDPESIVKHGQVATATICHFQCFAGGFDLLVPKARNMYAKAIEKEPPSVRARIESALDQAGRQQAKSVLGAPTQKRALVLHAVHATGALMKHEVQTLALGPFRNCALKK